MRTTIFFIILLAIVMREEYAIGNNNYHAIPDVGVVDSLLELSKSFVAIDNEIALLYAEKARQQINQVSYSKGMIKYLLLKARIAYYNDNYEWAFELFDSINPLLNFNDASVELACYYSQKALVNICLGNYETSGVLTMKSIEVNKELNRMPEIALGYNLMGRIFLEQDEIEKAEDYFQLAYKTILETKDDLSHAKILGNMGEIEELKGNNKRALGHYQQSSILFDKRGDLRGMASSLMRMAGIKVQQKDFKNAIYNLEEAEKIYSKLDEKYGICLVKNKLSMAHFEAGNIPIAINNAIASLQISKQINSKPLIAQAYESLFTIYEKKGDLRKALDAFKAFEEINTELISWQNNKQIATVEHNAEIKAKEKDIQILAQKNRIRTLQVYFLIPFVFLLILSTGSIVLFLRMKNFKLGKEQEILEKRNRISEIENQLQKQKQKTLENELELKNRELASKALFILQMNETLQDISSKINHANLGRTFEEKQKLKNIVGEIQLATNSNIWEEFDVAFNQVHTSFYSKLLKVCPNLSSTEIKIAALLKLNLSTKEIASVTFKSVSAIKTTRSRLRTKLNLSRDENLIGYLLML